MSQAVRASGRQSAATRRASAAKQRWIFIREFVRAPGVVAAVAPSSRHLAAEMVKGMDFEAASTIVEYGPGLGTFTDAMLKRIRAATAPAPTTAHTFSTNGAGSRSTPRVIAIERNAHIAEIFRQKHPEVTLHVDDAQNVRPILRREGIRNVDYVVSGLGWPSFSDEMRVRILAATANVLKPGGEFRTFGYHCGLLMRGAWHFRRTIDRLFSEVTISRIVWRNMPPAFVYRCIR